TATTPPAFPPRGGDRPVQFLPIRYSDRSQCVFRAASLIARDEVGPAGVYRGMSSPAATAVSAFDPAHLPDDPAFLKAMLAEVLAALRASRQEGERLRERLDQLLRRLYGPRSERLHPDQLLLFAEPPAGGEVTPPPPADAGEAAKPRRKGHGRQQLP